MKKSAICKLSLAFAICCAVICGIAIAPLVVSAVFAIVAFLCLLACVLIFIAGLFVWLFSFGQSSIFDYASTTADFGLGLFNFITPVAEFSFHYITPIAGWVAFGVGVLGIIFASVGLAKAKKQIPQVEWQGELPDAPIVTDTAEAIPTEKPGKKQKKKKNKTEKGTCIAALVVSIVFAVVALIAVLVAALAVTMF